MLVVGFFVAARRGPVLLGDRSRAGLAGRARALHPRALRRLPVAHVAAGGSRGRRRPRAALLRAPGLARAGGAVAVALAVARSRRLVFARAFRAAGDSSCADGPASPTSFAERPRSRWTGNDSGMDASEPARCAPPPRGLGALARARRASCCLERECQQPWRWREVSRPSSRFSFSAERTGTCGPACGPSAAGCEAARRPTSLGLPRAVADDLRRSDFLLPRLTLQRGTGQTGRGWRLRAPACAAAIAAGATVEAASILTPPLSAGLRC